jgi:hypothetical protein
MVLPAASVASAESLPTGPGHRGIVTVGNYQIFPENRPGNAVYGEGTLLLTVPGQIIQDVVPLPTKNKFIYLVRRADTRTVAVRNGSNDPAPRVTEVSPGYYFVVTVLDGVAYKKLLRLTPGNLIDLLPLSKTADGITVGPKGIAFFHIGKSDQQPDGKPVYSMGVHFASFDDGKVRHLPEMIGNALPSFAFKWLDETHFEFKLADGTSRTVSITDLK